MAEPSQILTGVFVGNQYTAADPAFFNLHKITHVVNCTGSVPAFFEGRVKYFRIPVDDASDEVNNNIMAAYMLPAVKFIMDSKPSANNGVLIHCQAGISRSCTIAAALLRFCCVPTVKDAITTVMLRRDIAFFGGRYVNFSKALYKVYGE